MVEQTRATLGTFPVPQASIDKLAEQAKATPKPMNRAERRAAAKVAAGPFPIQKQTETPAVEPVALPEVADTHTRPDTGTASRTGSDPLDLAQAEDLSAFATASAAVIVRGYAESADSVREVGVLSRLCVLYAEADKSLRVRVLRALGATAIDKADNKALSALLFPELSKVMSGTQTAAQARIAWYLRVGRGSVPTKSKTLGAKLVSHAVALFNLATEDDKDGRKAVAGIIAAWPVYASDISDKLDELEAKKKAKLDKVEVRKVAASNQAHEWAQAIFSKSPTAKKASL